jgi:hypothetical protein
VPAASRILARSLSLSEDTIRLGTKRIFIGSSPT